MNSMPQLERFALDDSQCISIAPLSACENLKELSLTSNYELPDYSAITGLTGLESLNIDKYSNPAGPGSLGHDQHENADPGRFQRLLVFARRGRAYGADHRGLLHRRSPRRTFPV